MGVYCTEALSWPEVRCEVVWFEGVQYTVLYTQYIVLYGQDCEDGWAKRHMDKGCMRYI